MSNRLDELSVQRRQIDIEIINESEKARKLADEEFQKKEKAEKAASLAEQEASKRQTEQYLALKAQADRQSGEASRAAYTARMSYFASILPDAGSMPKCRDCARPLTFSTIPPVVEPYYRFQGSKPVGTTTLACPNCHRTVIAQFDNPNFPMRFE